MGARITDTLCHKQVKQSSSMQDALAMFSAQHVLQKKSDELQETQVFSDRRVVDVKDIMLLKEDELENEDGNLPFA